MWKGFVAESKSYMNHPDCWKGWNRYFPHRHELGGWTDADARRAKLKFWRAFPRAWLCFYWATFCYALRKHMFTVSKFAKKHFEAKAEDC